MLAVHGKSKVVEHGLMKTKFAAGLGCSGSLHRGIVPFVPGAVVNDATPPGTGVDRGSICT